VITALITAVAGYLVGSSLENKKYEFGSSLETQKQYLQIQLSAYADFAKAQAAWQRADAVAKQLAQNAGIDPAITDASLKLREAIFRIVLFSPAEVVRAVAAFTEQTRNEECEVPEAELAVYQQMRRRIIPEDVTNKEITMALFGCKLK